MHDAPTEALAGLPAKAVAPCEGTGYEIGSMSIIKGARNLDNAKKFYDWALTADAQKIARRRSSSSFRRTGTRRSLPSPRALPT
jgi:iron(III) transport system substrate-binding protein